MIQALRYLAILTNAGSVLYRLGTEWRLINTALLWAGSELVSWVEQLHIPQSRQVQLRLVQISIMKDECFYYCQGAFPKGKKVFKR